MSNEFHGPSSGVNPDANNDVMRLRQSDLLHTETPSNLFTDAYNVVRNNPIESAAVAAIGVASLMALSRRFGQEVIRSEMRNGEGALTLEGKKIPDIQRPQVAESNFSLDAVKQKASASYSEDLSKIWKLPATGRANEGENLAGFAERNLRDRATLTGERINPEAIAKELDRISKLNPEINADAILSGKVLNVNTPDSLLKAAEELQFKHVPQIGQFLKGTGKISEEQIGKALEIQRAIPQGAPRKLIGEILVENKLAAQADVDLAFSNQQELKAALKEVREKFVKDNFPKN